MDGFGGRRMNQRQNKRERVCDEKAKRICRSRGERRGDSNADYLHKTYSESKRENKRAAEKWTYCIIARLCQQSLKQAAFSVSACFPD